MQLDRETTEPTILVCIDIARSTGLFDDAELDILDEVLRECLGGAETTYRYIEERRDRRIVGFLVYGRVPMTRSAWDLYWVAVAKDLQGQGIGRHLLARMREEILREEEWGVIRLETAGRDAYSPTRAFYERCGFRVAGTIPDFYRAGDALVTYSQSISR